MATPKLKLGNDKWATKQRSLLAYNDEGNNFKSLPFQVERLSGGSYVGRNGLIQYAATEEPRIDFTNYSKGALLLEPQRTNYATYSNDASQWSNITQNGTVTATANYSVAPDGTNTATRLQMSVSGSGYALKSRSTTSFFGDYSASVYLKTTSGNNQNVCMTGRNAGNNVFTVTGEWQRFEINGSTTSGLNAYFNLGVYTSFTGADNPIDILVWGGQLEAGDYSTSYIPTTNSAATRIVDFTENDSIPGDLINSTEGTIFIDFEYLYETTSSSSTDANRDYFVLGTSADVSEGISIDNYRSQFRVFVQGSGMTTQSIGNNTTGAAQPNTRYKLAVKYKTGDCKAYLNGSLLGSGTGTVNFVTDLDGIFFSYNSSSRPYKNQKRVYDLQYFDTALTDAELTTLTTL